MPISAKSDDKPAGQNIAIIAETLYLVNLLLLPGIAFLILLGIYWKNPAAAPLARNHLRQSVVASLWIGGLLVIPVFMLLIFAGHDSLNAWMLGLTWIITCHGCFVVLGAVALAKALAGQSWRYPLIGPKLSVDESF